MRDDAIAAVDKKLRDYTTQEKSKIEERVTEYSLQAQLELKTQTRRNYDAAVRQVYFMQLNFSLNVM